MWPAIGAIGGALVGGLFGKSAQSSANKVNIQLNRENRDWMEKMSNTEWQRGVQDMKAAGLNPMLAYSQGGANSPQNSAATVQPEDALAKSVTSAAANALQAQQMQANIDLTKANTVKTLEEAKTAGVTSGNAEDRQQAEIAEIRNRTLNIMAQQDLTDTERQRLEDTMPSIIKMERERARLTEMQANTAGSESRLKAAQIPSAEAEAKLWNEMSGTNADLGSLAKLILLIRSMIR